MSVSNQGSGVVSELEKAAMRGEPMPDGLSLVDQVYFQGLAHLYARFHLKVIDRATGSREKGQMSYQYDLSKRSQEFESKMAKYHAELRKQTEGALNRYRKERTLEAADNLANVLEGKLQ